MHAVAAELAALRERIGAILDEETAALVVRFADETLHRAARTLADDTVFLLTGDIPAMWLRDSAAQVLPLIRLGDALPAAEGFAVAVLRRQLACIALDPYANAFNAGPDGAGHQSDETAMSPDVWERKYEVDSLCYPLHLAYRIWRGYGRTDVFDAGYWAAVERVVELWETEQDHENASTYRFQRHDAPASDSLERVGRGPLVAVTGLTWSAFRPSDDACAYGYNVPDNQFAAVVLGRLAEIGEAAPPPGPTGADLLARAAKLRTAIEDGLRAHALIDDPETGPRWAYEVDGYGGVLEADDANVPSLLSLPLLGYCRREDPVYLATRAFVLSERNPTYHRGSAASGVGSPHTPDRHVWPIALAVAALTDTDEQAKRDALRTLLATRGGTDRIHESFHADRPETWTRGWFSWAEAMFCELALECCGFPDPEKG
ncbi:glycoside hydrolase family 125 protein [Actinospica durhamensis]|uniref:Glycoside hydrolase family 125 protein n=1 Tax=Actinospica durhamensis TaxID=1508375 RepID=A0A941EMH9_9ACTN|nr:glycoside hydrolase family 125 protein [Actinospica durhamensis]MBR7833103.1 glycoside hydrolase family 125 protein [Actinospica durhamensis]